jgi:hypothetical protein
MTKHDWFWVFVKVAGLAALLYAVFAAVTILTLFGDMQFGSVLWRLMLNVGLIGAAGIWLIRGGSVLTDLARARDRETKG